MQIYKWHAYMYIHLHTHIHIYIYIYIHTYIHVPYIQTHMYVCTYIRTYMYITYMHIITTILPAGVTPEKFGVAPWVGVPKLGVLSKGVLPATRWLAGVSSQRDFLRLLPWGVGVSVTESLWGVSAQPVWLGVSPKKVQTILGKQITAIRKIRLP